LSYLGKVELSAETEISKFWNAVCSGHVVRDNNILSFTTQGISWMIDEDLPMIYERTVYNEIFEELRDGGLKKMLVLGTPGIGKSLLEFYLMYRFASEWKDGTTHSIMYKTRNEHSPRRYLFETNGTQHRVFLVNDSNAFIEPDYYFTDTYSDTDYTPIKTKVHVTSPSESKAYDQFAKSVDLLQTHDKGDVKIMLPFTWEEAKCILHILNQRKIQKLKPQISEEEFQFKYWVFGGSARLLSIFTKEEVSEEIKEFVETEMSDFFDGVTTEANTRGGSLSLKEAFPTTWESTCRLIASRLTFRDRGTLSAEVVKQSMFEHMLQGDEYDWASSFMKYLAGAIVDGHNKAFLSELRTLFNNSNAALGAAFERSAIKEILANLRDGQAYSCVNLKKGKAAKVKSWELKGKLTRKVIINKIEDIGNMRKGEVGVPSIVNFALVDLVYKKANDELILFNMFYGDGRTHRGAVDRLKDIRHRKHNGNNDKDKMIFVLKAENTAFVYQEDLKDIDQFRMDFNLSRVGNKRKRDDSRESKSQSSKKKKT